MRSIAILVTLVFGLILSLAIALGHGGHQGLTKAQKDALLSRKKWYVTYDFSQVGSGEGWKIDEHSAGMIELNMSVPGAFPPSSLPITNPVLEPGRYIGWMAAPDEKTQAAAAQGPPDPAKMLGVFFPYERNTNDNYDNGGDIDTFRGSGTGYAGGVAQLYFDLKNETFDFIFQLGATDFGAKVIHEWHHGENNSGTEEWSSPGSLSGWFPKEWEPRLGKRKFSQDMKPDGTISFSITEDIERGVFAHGKEKVRASVSFRISPSPPSLAELTLTPDEDYAISFRPIPGKSETDRGNGFEVDWDVTEKGVPKEKQAKVEKVTFRLGNVSRYPGVCMNWPRPGPPPPGGKPLEPKPDLAFDTDLPLVNSDYHLKDDNQVLVIGGDTAERGHGTVGIYSYDGAAMGELVAEAELKDGRILTGHIAGQTAMNKLVIPDRQEGVSDLPKWWRTQWANGKSDSDDNETDPEGDPDAPGDGLTVWEEYRGFYEGGQWSDSCNPAKKDLFVDNKVGAAAQCGIDLFASITGLIVHDDLRLAEHRMDKVVNYLIRSDRHSVDQHCLILRAGSGSVGTAQMISGKRFPGPPKNTDVVNVIMGVSTIDRVVNMAPGVTATRNRQAQHIAHELCHSIGVYHHGDRDPWFDDQHPGVMWFARATFGRTQIVEGLESGPEVRVFRESNTELPPETFFVGGAREALVTVGKQFGQHSGDADCVMRYCVARFYERTASPHQYYIHADDEPPGGSLCTSPGGTLFNFPTHQPQSRYGGADNLRGDCSHQFVINDKYDKKDREKP